MFKQLKSFTVQMVAGANVATVVLMLLVGYSDRLNPVEHPMLSTVGMAFPFFLVANLGFLLFWLLFKKRFALIPVVGFLLAYVPISIYMPMHIHGELPEGTIKLISYNVCSYGGNYIYEKGFEAINEYLREEEPDIVCLQEDVDNWRRYVFDEYKKYLPYNDTLVICKSAKSMNAIGIHTRYPIIRRERIDYPSFANGSCAWWLQIGKDTVIVVNNHFESCHLNEKDRRQYRHIIKGEMDRDSARVESQQLLVKLAEANAKRAVQIDAVCQYVNEHSRYPIIVCGDFNDNPISYSRRTMAQVLTDCYVAAGRGIGLSYNQKAFFFRIDHVFCSKDIVPYRCEIDSKFDASDHFPLICWLKIGGNH